MAYYTALINAWNSATQPPTGVTGTGLTGSMTTAQKLAAVNAWTVTGVVPASFHVTGAQLANCINWAESAALTAQQQSSLLMHCLQKWQLPGGSANTAHLAAGLILAYCTNLSGLTIRALTALAQATGQPGRQSASYSSPFNTNDLAAAGGPT